LEKFKAHEKTRSHEFAAGQLLHQNCSNPVFAQLSQQAADEQGAARQALRLIITSVLYLGQQGLALRSHENHEGNFSQLLELRSSDVQTFRHWRGRTLPTVHRRTFHKNRSQMTSMPMNQEQITDDQHADEPCPPASGLSAPKVTIDTGVVLEMNNNEPFPAISLLLLSWH